MLVLLGAGGQIVAMSSGVHRYISETAERHLQVCPVMTSGRERRDGQVGWHGFTELCELSKPRAGRGREIADAVLESR